MIYDNPNATQYVYGPFNNDSGAYVQYDSDTDGDRQWMLVLDLEQVLIVELH